MLTSALVLVLAAEPVSLAVSRISSLGNFEVGEARLVNAVVESLRASAVEVVSPAQAVQRLGADRKGELFGCVAEDDDCLRALGEALRVQGVVRGELSQRSDDLIQLRLEVRSARDARPLATFLEAGIDPSDVPRAAAAGARLLAADLSERGADALTFAPAVHAWATSPFLRKAAWTALALAGTTAAVGTVCVLRRETRFREVEEVNNQHPTQPRVDYLASDDARGLFSVALGTFITSGVALASYGLLWWLGTRPTPLELTLGPAPGGGVVGVAGAF